MALTFPTSLFGFLEQEVDVERQTLKGGTALSGEQDVTSTDGGGRVFAEFSAGALVDRDKIMAWRALLGQLEEGVTPVIAPFCDIRHTPHGNTQRVPHSDDTPFSDGSLYVGGGPIANAAFTAARRATMLILDVSLSRPLIGGEWFTITHPNKRERAYKVRSVEKQEGIRATVRFVPPLDEAVMAGEVVDFRNPRCLMVQDGRASSRIQNKRYTEAAIRFIEAP